LMNYIDQTQIISEYKLYKKYNDVYVTIIKANSKFKSEKRKSSSVFFGGVNERLNSRTRIKEEFVELISMTISLLVYKGEDKQFLLKEMYDNKYIVFNHVLKLEDLIENYKITNKYNFAFKKACIEFYSDMKIYDSYLSKADAEYVFELLSYYFGFEKLHSNSIKFGSHVVQFFRIYKNKVNIKSPKDKYRLDKQMINDLLNKEPYFFN
jgi:hypothetical protein